MMMRLAMPLLLLLLLVVVPTLGRITTPLGRPVVHDDLLGSAEASGIPLDVSELLDDPRAAREASEVQLGNRTSYAGFFATPNGHMYWWYVPAANGNASAPLLLWLQGGPGGSSLFGALVENGPFAVSEDLELVPNPGSWNENYGMLFVDNPVGAGYSYPGSEDQYCKNTKQCVAENLHSVLIQFYTAFPDQLDVDFYVTGESYGGHYVPALAFYIHEHQDEVPLTIPLKGLAIGDGWVWPIKQLKAYPELMYSLGLADAQQRAVIQDYVDRSADAIAAGKMTEACAYMCD